MRASNLGGDGGSPVAAAWMRRLARLPVLALAIAGLVSGMAGGLARLGWDWPGQATDLWAHHGPLMVSTVFGTVIGLERAVASGRGWAYWAPVMSGVAGVMLVAGAPVPSVVALFVAAAFILLVTTLAMVRVSPELHTLVLAGSCLCWVAGNALWLAGFPLSAAVPWWIGFLVLVITGERLELSRLLKPLPGRTPLFLAAAALLLGGIARSALPCDGALAPVGPGLLAMALWLARFDIAHRTVRQSGLPRYVAVCLLAGYAWLGAAGVLVVWDEVVAASFLRDAALHAVFLGFVLTMVFAHAPIILPALLRVTVRYSPVFYVHVAVLHASVAFRVLADLLEGTGARAWAGLGNSVAILMFAALMATAIWRGRTPARR
ncbi:hypothetical protein [Azospirillum canadense]|uniref:hypothetical protein n=1 Tax=Azospirillum canadense TaxID=403962 RepID=UPI00222734B1|nr:hypothetical protein [Azospirillum canadense]MCW2241505.1 hypothetical protein [Azospirillum canadense]